MWKTKDSVITDILHERTLVVLQTHIHCVSKTFTKLQHLLIIFDRGIEIEREERERDFI